MGIIAGILAVFSAIGTAAGGIATGLGASAALAADIGLGVTGLAEGAALGAITGAVTGGNVGKDALFGGITGGILGAGAPILEGLGVSPALAGTLAGAGGGAAGAAATGRPILTGALTGGAGGFVSQGVLGGGGGSMAGTAAPPPSVSGANSDIVDLSGSAAPASASFDAPPVTDTGALPSAGAGAGAGAASAVSANIPGAYGVGAATGAPTTPGLGGAGSPLGPPPSPISAVNPGPLTSSVNLPGSYTLGTGGIDTPGTGGGFTGGDSGSPGGSIATGGASGASSGFLGTLGKNPLLLGALGLDLLRGNRAPPYSTQLATTAAEEAAQGHLLENYLTSGTLPPGIQGELNSATASADAATNSMYAARGESGSSARSQDLQNLQFQSLGEGASIAQSLFQEGLSETNISDQLYLQLMQTAMQQDQNLSTSIGNLVAAMALSSRPVTPIYQ